MRMSITIRLRRVTGPRGCAIAWRRPSPRPRSGVVVGPHPRSMYQVAFPRALLATFLPWLMLNRDGLTILVHPETGDDLADHTDHAAWLGGILRLRLGVFRRA